ncbi:MAG: hypothetical protein OXC72_11630 [Roseovarius sp.]|nr:hypothetical protein [Roseovarius sp.]
MFDDPIKDNPKALDNPAHALLVAAKEMPLEDIAKIRTYLTKLFSDLRRFSTCMPKDSRQNNSIKTVD